MYRQIQWFRKNYADKHVDDQAHRITLATTLFSENSERVLKEIKKGLTVRKKWGSQRTSPKKYLTVLYF